MLSFALRRVGILAITLILVIVISFLLLHIAPGDPASVAAGPDADAATIEAARQALGLDQPLPVQFWDYVSRLLQFDLGDSFVERRPVLGMIGDRVSVTASLVVLSLVISLLISLPVGICAAVRRGTMFDRLSVLVSSLGVALPDFFVGLVLVLVFVLQFGWFDATGYVPLTENPWEWLRHLLLPATALGIAVAAELTRHVRASVSDVLELDYVRTARAKGLGSLSVVLKHAFRNAVLPVITVFGNQVARLLGGTVIIEQIFNLPGLGQMLVQSIFNRDLPLVLGMGVFIAFVVLVVNALIDMSYGWFNPQVRS